MLKSHEKFHSANGKRLILVADDERINRESRGGRWSFFVRRKRRPLPPGSVQMDFW